MFELSKQALFFFSAIGAFNGLLLAAYVSINNRGNFSYYFLSALLAMISIRVGKSVLFYFSPELDKTILQLGLSACFLIGPFTYFYTLTNIHKLSTLTKFQTTHLTLLASITVLVGVVFPYPDYPELWGSYLYKVVNYCWLVYLVMAWVEIYKKYYQKQPLFQAKNTLLLGVNIGVTVIWLAYYTASFTSYILGALSFSFIVYVTIIMLIKYKSVDKSESYQSKKFDEKTVTDLSHNLEQTMLQNDYFCDPLLTMPKLAQKMGVTGAQVSQLLNDNFNKSFTTYVNEMRVEKAKGLLIAESSLTMEAVAEKCGYNSMSTFYNAFKKIVGTTPAKYRRDNSE